MSKLTNFDKATLGLPRVQAIPLRDDQGAITHEYDADLGYVFDVRSWDGTFSIECPAVHNPRQRVVLSPAVAEQLYHFLKTHFDVPVAQEPIPKEVGPPPAATGSSHS